MIYILSTQNLASLFNVQYKINKKWIRRAAKITSTLKRVCRLKSTSSYLNIRGTFAIHSYYFLDTSHMSNTFTS